MYYEILVLNKKMIGIIDKLLPIIKTTIWVCAVGGIIGSTYGNVLQIEKNNIKIIEITTLTGRLLSAIICGGFVWLIAYFIPYKYKILALISIMPTMINGINPLIEIKYSVIK